MYVAKTIGLQFLISCDIEAEQHEICREIKFVVIIAYIDMRFGGFLLKMFINLYSDHYCINLSLSLPDFPRCMSWIT